MPRKLPNRSQKSYVEAGEVRIIGGQWRNRKLAVPSVDGLRPTTDRVRETVFNWLQPYTANSRCLDICAGSGALGFEALSRGATSVQFIEKEKQAVHFLQKNAQKLDMLESNQLHIQQTAALNFLTKNVHSEHFDIVFVDPPFALNMHSDIFSALQDGQWLANEALIYCEMPVNEMVVLPENWSWFRKKSTKSLTFGLIAA